MRWWGGLCAHFLVAPPRCIQAGCVMPGAAHIYIFINTGLYNEPRLCQEQHFSECRARKPGRGNKGATATFSGTGRVHTARLYTLGEVHMDTDDERLLLFLYTINIHIYIYI